MHVRDIYCEFNHVDNIDRSRAVSFPGEKPGYVQDNLFKYMVKLFHPELEKPVYFAWLAEEGNFFASDHKRDAFLKDMLDRCFAGPGMNPEENAYNDDILRKVRGSFRKRARV